MAEIEEIDLDENSPESQLRKAIEVQDIGNLRELLAKNDLPLTDAVFLAFEAGNVEIIKLIVERGLTRFKYNDFDAVIRYLSGAYSSCISESDRLEIANYVLPLLLKNSPILIDRDILNWISSSVESENFTAVQMLMENFYSEPKNKLFPLMKSLEAAVENSHYLLMILHSEIDHFEYIEEYMWEKIGKIVLIFVKLLLKDTLETMQLAIEIIRVSLEKQIGFVMDLLAENPWYFPFQELKQKVEFISPVLQKRLFQMLFYLFDTDDDCKIWSLIMDWFRLCCLYFREYYYQFCQFLFPFIIKPFFKWKINPIIRGADGFQKLEEALSDEM